MAEKLNESDLDALSAFNIQVDELYFSTFPQSAQSWYDNNDFSMVLKNGEVSFGDFYVPEKNALKSFLMTYKTLTEKTYNHCSLFNIATIYGKLSDNLDEKMQFNKWRNEINSFLDDVDPSFNIKDKDGVYLTRRKVIDTYLNGIYAHMVEKKNNAINEWSANPVEGSFHFYYFIKSLLIVADRLFQIKLVNESALNDKSLHG